MTDEKVRNPIAIKQAIDRAIEAIYNKSMNEYDTRTALVQLGERVTKLLALPDAGLRSRGQIVKTEIINNKPQEA